MDLMLQMMTGGGRRLPKNGLRAYIPANTMVDTIGGSTVIKSRVPSNAHPTIQQVKASGFTGAGSATVTGLLTTDTITASGIIPTCTVNGTLTFGADCWDIYVHRDGVLWASWPGINIGQPTELDASGNGNHLTALTTTTITERADGSGTDYCNVSGFSERENILKYSNTPDQWTLGNASGQASLVGNVAVLKAKWDVVRNNTYASTAGRQKVISVDTASINDTRHVRLTQFYGSTLFEVFVPAGDRYSYVFTETGTITAGNVYYQVGGVAGETVTVAISDMCVSEGGEVELPDITKLVCLGDSITAQNHYVSYMDYVLSSTVVVNAGVSGNTLSQMDARFESDVASESPTIVTVLGGVNDARSGVELSVMIAAAESIANKAAAAGIPLIWIEPLPFGSDTLWTQSKQDVYDDFRAWLLAFAGDAFVPMYDNFRNGLLHSMPSGASSDGVHPIDVAGKMIGVVCLDKLGVKYSQHVQTTALPITGRQPANFQSFTDNQGPLRRDLIVTAGDTYPDVTAKAPLGAMFQWIPEWSGEAEVSIDTFTSTANTRKGTKGVAIYDTEQDAEAIAKIDKYLGV
jgi:hypothetical protein